MDEQPITPYAGPVLDAEGNLTYIGVDGRRYVIGLPAEIDEACIERVMLLLRRGNTLFHEIESLCHRWIAQVSGPDLDSRAALVLLLTTMETALEENYPDNESG